MHQRNRLFNLYAANAKRGSVRAQADSNTIWLYDFIVGSDEEAAWWGGISPESFAKTLRAMSGPVTLRINSPGGDVFAGIAIAQAIREYADGVTVVIDGLAASIASIIAIAGQRVTAAPGSFMMIHKAWTFMIGNSDQLLREASLLEKIDGQLADQYRAKAGGDTDWAAAMATGDGNGTWYTVEEAIAAGLIDALASEAAVPGDSAQAKARWDLSAFDNAPAALSPTLVRNELSPGLSARQGAMYAGVEAIAEEFGAFDQTSGADGAHYMAANPFAAEGIKCVNCSLYAGGRACEVVAGDIDPEAVCKLWIIQPDLIGTPGSGQTDDIAARVRRLTADLLLRPA